MFVSLCLLHDLSKLIYNAEPSGNCKIEQQICVCKEKGVLCQASAYIMFQFPLYVSVPYTVSFLRRTSVILRKRDVLLVPRVSKLQKVSYCYLEYDECNPAASESN